MAYGVGGIPGRRRTDAGAAPPHIRCDLRDGAGLLIYRLAIRRVSARRQHRCVPVPGPLPGGLAILVVPAIIFFLLPESPRWHLRRGEAQIATDIVNQIIRRSGNRAPQLTVAELGQVHEAAGRETLPPYWALFAKGQLRWTVVG